MAEKTSSVKSMVLVGGEAIIVVFVLLEIGRFCWGIINGGIEVQGKRGLGVGKLEKSKGNGERGLRIWTLEGEIQMLVEKEEELKEAAIEESMEAFLCCL